MYSRINLDNYNCTELHITTDIELPKDLVTKICNESFSVKSNSKFVYCIYGSIYNVDNKPHVIRADVRREGKKYKLEISYQPRKASKPPRRIKSVASLARNLKGVSQDTIVEADAIFKYKKKEGWVSQFDIPIALPKAKGADPPFTHIEAIRLSKRIKGDVQQSVQIRKNKNGDIINWVYIRLPWNKALSKQLLQILINNSSELSKAFVIKE